MTPAVLARDWGWRHASRRAWAVRHLTFSVEQGERVLLLGPSGAGKSTLLAALSGTLGSAGEGEEEGLLQVAGRRAAGLRGHAGLMMQDPQSQIVLARVGDDVAFGCENMAVPPDQIWGRVRASLDGVGLDLPLDHPTAHLSGGQQQRLVLAGALAMGAELLLLDEPTANLDPAGVIQVRDGVADVLADRTRTLIVIEHHSEIWAPLVDRVMVLTQEGIVADGPPDEVFPVMGDELAAMGVWVPRHHSPPVPKPHPGSAPSAAVAPIRTVPPVSEPSPLMIAPSPGDAPILRAERLTIGYPGSPVRAGLDLAIPAGVSTVITGANGSGKTTLALTLAGLLPPLAGTVIAAGALAPAGTPRPHTWKSHELLTRIGTVFQSPDHQFVAATVADEIAVGLRALRQPAAQIESTVAHHLEILRLAHLAKANPFTLSGGEKRRLSVATVLACNPQVIVLDEPTFGQDRLTWAGLVDLIEQLVRGGTTVVSVTHDAAYTDALGQHLIDLEAIGEPA